MASTPEFQHLKLSRVGDVVVVEIISKDLRGPEAAQELGRELSLVVAQDWAKQLLLNFRRIGYLSSTGFAVLFKLVNQFQTSGGQLKICEMEPGIRLGAEIVGLDKMVEIHDSESATIAAFKKKG